MVPSARRNSSPIRSRRAFASGRSEVPCSSTQPFHVAEQFTGMKGAFVSIEDTIKGFNMIMDGKVDQYPEAAFMMVGTIEEAIEKGEKLINK